MKSTKTHTKKDFYTTYEAGNLLFVSHSTVIDWINSGKLKATKTLGGHRRIPRSELEGFVRKNNMSTNDRKKKRILIVDDDKTIRIGLKEILHDRGFIVETAGDGFEAGVLAIQKEPDLIILDLLMPKMDGFAVFKELKNEKWSEYMDIPILILTSIREEASRRRYELETGQELNADDYIEKPLSPEILLASIEKLFETRN